MTMTMAEQTQPHGRARSDSLQRMLELEKKLLRQRSQGVVPSTKTQPSSPPVSHDPYPHSYAQSHSRPTTPGTQRRFELVPRKDKMAPIPARNYSAMPAPLVIHPPPTQPQSPGPIHRKQIGSEPSAPKYPSITAISPEKSTPKTVAFMFPPEVEEVRSVCQSPSWEAYDRRKKEKKEERRERKDEKKMKQQAIEDNRPRGRRLSKAPVPSPAVVPALGERSKTEPVVSGRQAQQKPRPSSVLGIPRRKTEEIEKPEKPKKRSGSLTSVIRASFEIRRPSIDRDTGFIGGVKLDQKKQDFQQQVLEDQAKGNNKVHPALRKSFIGYGSFTPIKTPPQSPKEEKESRRAYPPISIKSACERNPGLLKSAPPAKPDFTNMYLWSARASRGDESDNEFAIADDSEDQRGRKGKELPPVEQPSPHKENGLYRSGGIYVKSSPPVSYPGQFNQAPEAEKQGGAVVNEPLASAQAQHNKSIRSLDPSASEVRSVGASTPAKNKKGPDSASKPARSRRSSLTSLFSSTPDPPRKSSKRHSLVLGKTPTSTGNNDPPNLKQPPVPLKDPQHKPEKRQSGENHKSEQMIHSSPPSIPYERTSAGARPKMYSTESFSPVNNKWNIIDAVNAAFGRGLPSHPPTASSSAVASPSVEGGVPKPFEKSETQTSSQDDVEQLKKKRVSTSTPVILNVDELPGQKSGSNEPRTSVIWMPYTSSSEDDSYSDAPNSSIPSTPNTTPPQSEGGYPPSIHNFNKPRTNGHKRNDSGYTSGSSPQLLPATRFEAPSSTQTDSDSDFDPVDAAARKVMEAFSHTTNHKPTEKTRPRSSYYDQRPGNRDSVKFIAPSPLSSSLTNLTPQTSPSPITPLSPGFPPVSHRLATKSHRVHPTVNTNIHPNEPVAKMFVECCSCKYYHDMPSKLYEAMASPESVLGSTVDLGYMGKVSMTVKCPWCKHEMSTKCCAGLAAMVYIKERLH